MSYRAPQLSPQGTDARNTKVSVEGPWSDSPESPRGMQVFRTWFELDSERVDEKHSGSHRVNWSAVLGLVAVVGISAGFWTGVGLLIARLVR